MAVKYYLGVRRGLGHEWKVYAVHIAGRSEEIQPRHDLANHSPDGFAWGYSGSGPAQLSLALLAHHLGDDDEALRIYQPFKDAVVAAMDQGSDWRLAPEQIIRGIAAAEAI